MRQVFVKWKQRSHIHADWVNAHRVSTGRAEAKLKKRVAMECTDENLDRKPWAARYVNANGAPGGQLLKHSGHVEEYFDMENLEVERVLMQRSRQEMSVVDEARQAPVPRLILPSFLVLAGACPLVFAGANMGVKCAQTRV